jgi:hypothetical protein
MKVTLYKSADGTLHETHEAFAAREAQLKIEPAVRALVEQAAESNALDADERGLSVLYASVVFNDDVDKTIAGWIANNADALRTILNGAVINKRGRKPAAVATA